MWQGMKMALAAALSLAVLAVPTAVSADITDRRFEKKTKKVLEELQIPKEDVQSVKIVLLRKRNERSGPEILGAESWIRLNSCAAGHLVIVMNRAAFVLQTYTKGDCSVAGISDC